MRNCSCAQSCPRYVIRECNMYKVKHGLAPKHIPDIFTVKATQYSLRNSDYLIPRFNTVVYGKHSLRYIGPVMWSKLSTEMRNKPSLNAFKVAIRKMDVCGLMDNNLNCYDLCKT